MAEPPDGPISPSWARAGARAHRRTTPRAPCGGSRAPPSGGRRPRRRVRGARRSSPSRTSGTGPRSRGGTDLVGEAVRDLIAPQPATSSLAVRNVLGVEILVRAGVGCLVLLRIDLDRGARLPRHRMHGPSSRVENVRPEQVPRRRPLDDELGPCPRRRNGVGLAAEDERLQREAQRLAMLLARPEPKPLSTDIGPRCEGSAAARPNGEGERVPNERVVKHGIRRAAGARALRAAYDERRGRRGSASLECRGPSSCR